MKALFVLLKLLSFFFLASIGLAQRSFREPWAHDHVVVVELQTIRLFFMFT